MKKIIALLLLGSFLAMPGLCQSIHGISFNNIDGGSVSLSSYSGKKLVFIIAPISADDSKGLDEIMSFQQQHGSDSIVLIGIMSNEDGYSAANNTSIKSLYQSREVSIILTNGMYTKKSAGSNQSALMKWLTDKDENTILNIDANGIGHKFFISKTGKLIGTVPPEIAITDPLINSVLSRGN